MRRDQRAVGAIQHVEEPVLVRLDHHLAQPAVDLQIREQQFVRAVHVVDVVRRELVVAGNLAGLRTDREHARREEAVELAARMRIVRLRVARAPVDEIELRIVGARSPRRPAPVLPRVAVLGPRLRTRFARRGNRIALPQLPAGLRVPTSEESARGALAAGHSGNHDAVGDNRRTRRVVAVLLVRELLVPDLHARLHVERDEMVVVGDAIELAVVDRRGAAVDETADGSLFEHDRRAPDLPPGRDVDCERHLAVDDVHDAVVDRRRGELALVVHQARRPDRHEALHRGRVDLLERAVALSRVAHALRRHVFGVLAVVEQVVRALRQHRRGVHDDQQREQAELLHGAYSTPHASCIGSPRRSGRRRPSPEE